MATQTVEFSAPSGQTITARLFAAGSDTLAQTASSVTEATNRDGVYSATFTDAAAGLYKLIATNAGGTLLAQWWVDLTLATATFQSYEMPVSVVQSGLSTLDAAGVRTAVGMASANLDTQLSDLPTVAEFEARTLLAAAYFDAAADTVTVGVNQDKTGYSLTAGTGLGNQTADITGNLSGSVGSVTAGVTISTNNDKTGYDLSSTSVDAIVADFLAHIITKGSAGTIERAFWQAAKTQASADGEVSGTPTVSAFDTDLTAVDGAFDDLLIRFVSGSLEGEARPIATYSNTDGRITLQRPLTEAPSATDEFLIIPDHTYPISDIQSGLATSAALTEAKTEIDKIPRQGSTHKHRQISSDGATKSAVVTIEAST